MLSERQLARGYPMLWRRWMPGLDAEFIRQVAAPQGRLHSHVLRWAEPLAEKALETRSDLLAEVAFGLFAVAVQRGTAVNRIAAAEERRITHAARLRMEILRQRGLPPYSPTETTESLVLDADSSKRAHALALRLHQHLRAAGRPLEVQPRVAGTGLLQACHPDALRGDELIEVKMSKSSFRSSDIRQAVVYAALMQAEGGRNIQSISLVNPRLGVTWHFALDVLARETAGCPAGLLLDRIAGWAQMGSNAQGDDR